MEKLLDLKLTDKEIKIVFNALLERPFKEVAELVAKIQAVYRTASVPVQAEPPKEVTP